MPASRNVWNYPEMLWDAVEKAAIQGLIMEQVADSPRQALSIRGRFYGFKQALKREAAKLDMIQERWETQKATNPALAKPQQLQDSRNVRLRDVARRVDEVSCWVEGATIKIMPRDLSPIGLQFARFKPVGAAPLSQVEQQGLDAIAERLLKEQAEVDAARKPKTERDYG